MRRVETLRRQAGRHQIPGASPATILWRAGLPLVPAFAGHATLRQRNLLSDGETADACLVRWIPRTLPPTVRCAAPDPDAAGFLAFAFRPPLSDPVDAPQCVEIEAVGSYGARLPWPDGAKKRTLGPRRGSCFAVRGPGDRVHVAEGTADALALHRRWGETAVGVGGTAALRDPSLIRMLRGREAVVWADPGARQPAAELARAVGGRLMQTEHDPAEMHRLDWPGFDEAPACAESDSAAELAAEGWDEDDVEAILRSDCDSWTPEPPSQPGKDRFAGLQPCDPAEEFGDPMEEWENEGRFARF